MKKNNSQSTRILIIEDEKPLQEAIRIKAQDHGFDVLTCDSVEKALEILKAEKRVDAIWLDHYLLGDKNGLDLVVNIKAKGSMHSQTPIYLVSNTASEDKINSYIKLGIKKYYTKSNVSLEKVITDIKENLLKRKNAT